MATGYSGDRKPAPREWTWRCGSPISSWWLVSQEILLTIVSLSACVGAAKRALKQTRENDGNETHESPRAAAGTAFCPLWWVAVAGFPPGRAHAHALLGLSSRDRGPLVAATKVAAGGRTSREVKVRLVRLQITSRGRRTPSSASVARTPPRALPPGARSRAERARVSQLPGIQFVQLNAEFEPWVSVFTGGFTSSHFPSSLFSSQKHIPREGI